MLKKFAIVAGVASAATLALSPLAFAADEGGLLNISDIAAQVPIQACNNSVIEGVLGIVAKDQKNDDSHDGTCHQKNSATDDRSSDYDD